MGLSPFHALYKARTLAGYASGRLKLAAAYAASDIEVYPYQIAAARFALRSPYLKGCILCDDGSLGKSYEALLVITQMWYEGKDRILIVVPTPLLAQWAKIMENRFSVPFYMVDNNAAWDAHLESGGANPFEQDGVILTTYDFAAEKAEHLARIAWDMAVFEEAHHLRRIYTGDQRDAGPNSLSAHKYSPLAAALKDAFKLLLTATPMQNSIMDLYGLIHFIDETALPDADSFYKRYFRKPELYGELADRAGKYCFRTLRPQVATYVKIPERIVVTADFALSDKEQRLYDLLDSYIQKPEKIAFPKMEQYDLALMLFRTLSSSTFALAATLAGVEKRLSKLHSDEPDNAGIVEEHAQIADMLALAEGITENAKGRELLAALKKGFAELKKLGANKKALIFTENRTTQRYLRDLLDRGEYKGKVLTFNGDKSRDYSIMERFEADVQILISTDIAAEGFNLEFCSFVVNYDLPYNTLTIEQRVNRCHRQGQQSDVIVLNFLNRNNFADVRMLELINKRVLQFGGVFGMADDVIGGFGVDLSQSFGKALSGARTKAEIDRAYRETLTQFEEENKRLLARAEASLFTTFSKEIADSVTVTPQYIEETAKEINNDLWAVTKYFFEGRWQFHLDEETRTVSCAGSPPKVFTGTAMRRNEYSMTKGYQPASGRHTVVGTLAKNILSEMFWIGIPDSGTVVVDAELESCTIGYYRVKVKAKSDYFSAWYYNAFVGKTAAGRMLSHEECEEIMKLPVARYTKESETYGERDGISKTRRPHELDALIAPDAFIARTLAETEIAEREEIERLKAVAADKKTALSRRLDALRSELRAAEQGSEKSRSTMEKLEAKKRLAALQKELKQREQTLFTDGLRIDAACERQVRELIDNARLSAEVSRQFAIRVEGS